MENVNLHVPQGHLVAIIGPHASGKSCLLNLLATRLIPASGTICVPIHLRTLHVSAECCLLKLSPYDNLTFGLDDFIHSTGPTGDNSRIETILRRLRMTKTLELIEADLKNSPE